MKSKYTFGKLFATLAGVVCITLLHAQRRPYPTPPFNPRAPFVIWGKPGVSIDSALNYLKKNKLADPATLKVVKACPSCDSSVFTIYSSNFKIDPVQESISGTNKPGGGPSGDKDTVPIYTSRNYFLSMPDPDSPLTTILSFDTSRINALQTSTANKPVVKVGVLDTGIDPEVAKNYVGQWLTSCMDGGSKGWNFAGEDNITKDDYAPGNKKTLHGSPVTNFIIEQGAGGAVALQILPVKIMDANGKCDLFHVMCGLAYAQKAGVQIINASFGFYADRKYAAAFEEYVKYITGQGLIIVAAAGNENTGQDNLYKQSNPNATAKELRDLETNPFFPAAFSDKNENIVCVTTLSPKPPANKSMSAVISPKQNFSPAKTQVGVYADTKNFGFVEAAKGTVRTGSSYATPIVAGQIAANFNKLFPTGNVGKINRYEMLKKIFPQFDYIVPPPSPGASVPGIIKNKFAPSFQTEHIQKF